jgi:hypothetical protein
MAQPQVLQVGVGGGLAGGLLSRGLPRRAVGLLDDGSPVVAWSLGCLTKRLQSQRLVAVAVVLKFASSLLQVCFKFALSRVPVLDRP